jgi:hypothetical protein
MNPYLIVKRFLRQPAHRYFEWEKLMEASGFQEAFEICAETPELTRPAKIANAFDNTIYTFS